MPMTSSLDERARKKGKWIADSDPSTSDPESDTSLTLALLPRLEKSLHGAALWTTDLSTSNYEEAKSTVDFLARFEKQGEGTSHSNPSSSSEGEKLVPANQSLWRMLPDDILGLVLMRLIVSDRCRFRSVCRKWKQDLDSLPYLTAGSSTNMILSTPGNWNAKFFCHSVRQWFTLTPKLFQVPPLNRLGLYPSSEKSWELRRSPYHGKITVDSSLFTISSNVNQSSGPRWELVDVNAGLLCYQCEIEGTHWLCVSNPLTSLCEIIIPPDDVVLQLYIPRPLVLKLLVDRATKTYKLVALVDYPQSGKTALYDSSTGSWHYCKNYPNFYTRRDGNTHLLGGKEVFVWKNKIFVYDTKSFRSRQSVCDLFALNVESGLWTSHTLKFPRENGIDTNIFILSDEEQLKLVQYSFKRRPFFSVWRLVDNDSFPSRFDPFLKWQKLIKGSSQAIGRGIGSLAGYRVARVCFGEEFISFIFSSSEIKEDQSRTHKCARYSFATNEWTVVPCPAGWG